MVCTAFVCNFVLPSDTLSCPHLQHLSFTTGYIFAASKIILDIHFAQSSLPRNSIVNNSNYAVHNNYYFVIFVVEVLHFK
jgi:hypothetical protein